MSCFCDAVYKEDKIKAYDIDFYVDGKTEYYCRHWILRKTTGLLIVVGSSLIIVFINFWISFLIPFFTKFEKHHTE